MAPLLIRRNLPILMRRTCIYISQSLRQLPCYMHNIFHYLHFPISYTALFKLQFAFFLPSSITAAHFYLWNIPNFHCLFRHNFFYPPPCLFASFWADTDRDTQVATNRNADTKTRSHRDRCKDANERRIYGDMQTQRHRNANTNNRDADAKI